MSTALGRLKRGEGVITFAPCCAILRAVYYLAGGNENMRSGQMQTQSGREIFMGASESEPVSGYSVPVHVFTCF